MKAVAKFIPKIRGRGQDEHPKQSRDKTRNRVTKQALMP